MKPQKRMRSSKVDIAVDRLSEMPDEVLVHILSLMPTRDAVRTMLIRRFGSLWTMVHFISLDFNEYFASTCSDDDVDADDDDACYEKRRITIAAFSRFVSFVQNVLMLHRRSTVDSFHLNIANQTVPHLGPWVIDDIQVWLKFATDKKVRDLYFACDSHDGLATPRCIFTCQSLVTLTLYGSLLTLFELDEQQPQLHMGTLRKLSLLHVEGSNEAFNKLISACPSLQELEIYYAHGLRVLNITAPSVSKLDLTIIEAADQPFTLNCPHVQILNIAVREWSPSYLMDVIDVSSLRVVNVGRLPKCLSGLIIKAFLGQFRDAEFFKILLSGAFQQLCGLKKLDFPENRWQTLALQPRWDNERCLQVIIELVKSSVGLEKLIIEHGVSSGSETYSEVLGSELSTFVMPQLKNVIILGFGKCCEDQLQLIELILRNAVVLEKLEITFEKNRLTAVEELDFVKHVSRLKRASVNAIVDFS